MLAVQRPAFVAFTRAFSVLPAVGPGLVWLPAAVILLGMGQIVKGIIVIAAGVLVIGLVDNVLRPVIRQNFVRRQVIDLVGLIQRKSRRDGHPPAPPVSTSPDALRRPPSGCPGEPC